MANNKPATGKPIMENKKETKGFKKFFSLIVSKIIKGFKKVIKGFKKFFREIMSEVKKVSWPSVKELINNTVAVVVIILIFAAIIGIIDLGLGQLFNLIS